MTAAAEPVDQPGAASADAVAARLAFAWAPRPGLRGFVGDTDHKAIGLRFAVTALAFLAVGGALIPAQRLQLGRAGQTWLDPAAFERLALLEAWLPLLVALPAVQAFASYLVPLLTGARAPGLPRLNALSWWIHLAAGLLAFGGLVAGAPAAPLTAATVLLASLGALAGAAVVIVTIAERDVATAPRALPVVVTAHLAGAASAVPLLTATALAAALSLTDQAAGTHFLNTVQGGLGQLPATARDAAPLAAVALLLVPAAGWMSAIVETFSRRPLFAPRAVVVSLWLAVALGVFAAAGRVGGAAGTDVVAAASLLLALPFAIMACCWALTLAGGRLTMRAPLLLAVAGIVALTAAAFGTAAQAPEAIAARARGTTAATAHQLLLAWGFAVPLLAAVFYWFPKWTGRMLDEVLGARLAVLLAAGFAFTWVPLRVLGNAGMPTGVPSWGAGTGWTAWSGAASLGALLLAAALVVFVAGVRRSLAGGQPVGPNPWFAGTLEWSVESPPPRYNFVFPPAGGSRLPLWTGDSDVMAPADREPRRGSPWRQALCLTIGTLVIALIAALYLAVRGATTPFPPPSIRGDTAIIDTRPALTAAAVNLVLIVAVAGLTLWRRRTVAGAARRISLVVPWLGLAVLAIRALEFVAVKVRWDDHAYGSAVWALLAAHTALLLGAVLATTPRGGAAAPRHAALWWTWAAAVWLPVAALVFLLPRLP